MRLGWAAATILAMACMATVGQANQCNNRYYVNRSGNGGVPQRQ